MEFPYLGVIALGLQDQESLAIGRDTVGQTYNIHIGSFKNQPRGPRFELGFGGDRHCHRFATVAVEKFITANRPNGLFSELA